MRLREVYTACVQGRFFLVFLWWIIVTYWVSLYAYNYININRTKSYMTYMDYQSLLTNIKTMLQPLGYCDFYMDSTAHKDTDYVHVFAVKNAFVVHEFKIQYKGNEIIDVSEVNMVKPDQVPLHNSILHITT